MQTHDLREGSASGGCHCQPSSRGYSCMKSDIPVPSSCRYPPGLPQTLLALPPFSFWGGKVYISPIVLQCWTPSLSLALTLISMLGSRCHLKTMKPGNVY